MMGSETMVNICLPSESKTNNVDGIYIYPSVHITYSTYSESNGAAS